MDSSFLALNVQLGRFSNIKVRIIKYRLLRCLEDLQKIGGFFEKFSKIFCKINMKVIKIEVYIETDRYSREITKIIPLQIIRTT